MCVGAVHLMDACGKCPPQTTDNLTFHMMCLSLTANFKCLCLLAQMLPLCLAVVSEATVVLNAITAAPFLVGHLYF